MTEEEKALRDAWLAEMWPTVYEYVPGSKPTSTTVEKAEEKPRKKVA